MFQSAWYDRNNDRRNTSVSTAIPVSFVKAEDIETVVTLYWDEHCLECSAPECYATCPKYIERKDGLCKRLMYGIKYERSSNGLLWNVRIRFREWGKLEARINRGTLSPKDISIISRKDVIKTTFFKVCASIMPRSDMSIITKWDGLKRKKYAQIAGTTLFANDFLFQCYSFEDQLYRMNFEVADRANEVIYKTGFEVLPGYNQNMIKLEFIPPEGGLVRIYPENNLEAELTIFAADFVQLKKTIPPKPNKKIKCVAWDLDNTIWDGILAESVPEELQLRAHVKDTIEELDRRGIIQIVVSKNDKDSVDGILERLRIKSFFVYIFSNWNSKSVNIYNAARILNINVDTFGLVDDSVFERNEVKESLPCVRVYDENISSLLSNIEFDSMITTESRKRRESYQQEAARKTVLANSFSGNNTEFIKNCCIEITIGAIKNDDEIKRSYELLQRTNQLNLSAKKYTERDFSDCLLSDGSSLVIFVKDKYGDYGQVAYIHLLSSDVVRIDEFAMSCRVAGKYVESAIMNAILQVYEKDIVMIGQKTDRNQTLIDTLNKCGFDDQSKGNEICMWLRKDSQIPFAEINSIRWLQQER